ncbi:glycoside hydrolase family 38 N-terminal domain-containing protein [Solitalea canadensis]|uniref:Glycosyl hydrolases family 38 C-terminal domain protein n=1 Tax=Solitalea canadensis (strain ATCC 29591 / DSM 3403 / JCM 21819 / LMG 8368 / NBRC 15130 / NCIMB 12057 / USAM 9D) TaxID=929556 RepID=H8KTN8_SOLCM|nr:glycoside hydrolase [Solitalea canadensis]AFD06613.1 Glycosyl hydrolases family 38 C-terminal domain protein [Solitalea canadensis DSM 3403]
MRKVILSLFVIVLTVRSYAQLTVPYFGKIEWINGYAKEIKGENINYDSAYPEYATTALLTRCTDGKKEIVWETAPVPQKIKGKYIYFSWVAAHSSGTSAGTRYFDLYLNDEKLLTFTTQPAHQTPDWKFVAADSSALVFHQTKRDGASDAHGLAFLRLPLSKVKPGMPVKLKIVGQAEKSNDWYMTFKFSFEEKADVYPRPFLLKDQQQIIALTALHFGKEEQLHVKINNKELPPFRLQNGVNKFDIPVNAVQKEDSVMLRVAFGSKVLINKFVQLKPVKYRVLHFIHHSHTDIGYSHLQPEVLKIHLKNIDDALQMIESTRNLPKEAQFKWNIESLWAVENYMKQASPLQKEKFIAAVKEGSICLSALYANILTGLSQPEEMFHYTDYADKLRKEYGVTINSAMISDVPGFAWTTVTALAKGGVRYFSSGPNFLGESHPYWGDRAGHFVKTWGDKPVWWVSPSGDEKVLFWTGAKGYSSWHGVAPGGVFERGPGKIASYLNELDKNNYPYEMVQWRYNCVADNGPIDTAISRFVDQWNKKYASPKIVLNTTDKLFEEFEQKYGTQLQQVKGDITPYWEDGAASTAAEEGKNRVNSLRLQQLTTLYAMLNPSQYNQERFYEAWKNVIMFHEHTWGAHNSISQPDVSFVTEQWRIKKQFMLDADEEINGLEKELLQPFSNIKSKKIAVLNTLSWKRSGPVKLSADVSAKSVKDGSGKLLPLQKLKDGSYVFIAQDVPPLGTAIYELTNAEAPIAPTPFILTDNSLSNGKVSVQWDKTNGSLLNLNLGTDFNYAGDFSKQGLNSYWYVPGLNPADAETNGSVQLQVLENGPVLKTISLISDAPGANKLERRMNLYAGSQEVAIENIVDKKAIRNKEAVHFGFPFNETLCKTIIDVGYGSMQYITDQLPGSNMDYLYGRRWLDVNTSDRGVQWMLLEAPLVEPGNMIDERLVVPPSHKEWKKEGKPTATWFSYVMNNYWHTNYKADQEGIARFRYALRPHGKFSYSETEKMGSEFTQPLVALPVNESMGLKGGLFALSNNRIVVTSITPQQDGSFLIRLYNPESSSEQTKIQWQNLKPSQFINTNTGKTFQHNEAISLSGMGVLELRTIK